MKWVKGKIVLTKKEQAENDRYLELLFPPDFHYGEYRAKYYRNEYGLSGNACEIYQGEEHLGSVYYDPKTKEWVVSSLWEGHTKAELKEMIDNLPLPVKNKKPKWQD